MKSDKFIYEFDVTPCSMEEYLEVLKEKETFEGLCRKYSFNVSMLKPILKLTMRCYNNTEIATKLGVHRITVQRYVATFKKMPEEDFLRIYKYILSEEENDKYIYS